MKSKFLFFTLFLLPFLGFSQSKKSIDGFLDIPFGSDSATVKSAIFAKGGIKNDTASHQDYLTFMNVPINGKKAIVLNVRFVDNKVYQADFIFADFDDIDALNYYDNFSNDITAVYDKGKMTNNFGNSNNSARIKRLKSGNASCSTYWQSKNKNTVSLFFESLEGQKLEVYLQYQSSALWDLNAAKKRSDL